MDALLTDDFLNRNAVVYKYENKNDWLLMRRPIKEGVKEMGYCNMLMHSCEIQNAILLGGSEEIAIQ